ncbi:hypothetical protein CAF53_03230 [Sphingobium sp. LB126]|uniref:MFS transporter n=1 Tax=Sphingobium sp. LB126 TaxID=1983755 RepID=UPI000C1FF5C8|nr:MFS transporter [Sphingobium sp. LB126]PJG47360.1 hypothetical protein CAF53_03230 [Sphingobium sp. LB126]
MEWSELKPPPDPSTVVPAAGPALRRIGAQEFVTGWPLLIACFVGITLGISSLYFYSLGLFIKPLVAEFGWSRGQASLGAVAGTAGIAVMSIPVGRALDFIGSVPVAIVSLLALAVGFLALGTLVDGLMSFVILNGLLAIAATGCNPLPFTRLIVAQFERNRGFALGLALSGTGFGAILLPMLLGPYIAEFGWRAGYRLLAFIIAGATPLLWLVLRRYSAKGGGSATPLPLRVLFADPALRLLALIFFLAALAILGAIVQFIPMLSDAGLDAARAGHIAALIGFSAMAGRLAAGFMLDRVAPHNVATALMIVAGLGLTGLAIGGAKVAVAGALIVGLAVGAEVDLISFFCGRHFDRARYGQVYGAIYAAFFIGGAVGPALSGYLRDWSGDYATALGISAGLLFIAGALASRIGALPVVGATEAKE